MKKYNIAVVGATGRVGTEIIEILGERNFPLGVLYAVDNSDSAGKRISFMGEDTLVVKDINNFNFSDVDMVLSIAGEEVSKAFVGKAVEQGALVIDGTSCFREDPFIPLIIPEVNLDQIGNYKNKGVIASPNCTTVQMLMALAPLHKHYGIKRVVVSTYQSVSGAGNRGLDSLFNQTKKVYLNESVRESGSVFTKQIAFNIIPHIDTFLESGDTKEEWKLSFETKKILDSTIELTATCVRVPVFIGHAMSLNIELDSPFSEEEVVDILKGASGISVVNHRVDEGYVTPIESAGDDLVYISRIRRDSTLANALNMWVVADNLRKGSALNLINIAEEVVKINT